VASPRITNGFEFLGFGKDICSRVFDDIVAPVDAAIYQSTAIFLLNNTVTYWLVQ
jgi:hypothetical protein